MSAIRQHAEDYLAMRRALGFKLTTFGQKLLSFVDYLDAHDMIVLTTDAALTWATTTPRSSDEVHWSRRLMVVRVFARHLAVLDPATEIPPADLLRITTGGSPRTSTRQARSRHYFMPPTRCGRRCGR